jgi:carbonic anhydrase
MANNEEGKCMKTIYSKALMVAILGTFWTRVGFAQHWSYTGEAGPDNWGKLDAKFAMCGEGRNQSPINLADLIKADLKPLKFQYKDGVSGIVNNGHAVQVNYAKGSFVTVDGRTFELKQFHFHSPRENLIKGKQFPLEGHLVHADKDGNLAVIAVMFGEGPANPLLTWLWQMMPAKVGEKIALSAGFSIAQMLPSERDYYRYNGSLTTPPCTEGVWWLVLKRPATVSKEQVLQFSKALGFANNRPVLPVNARPVLE